MNKNQGFWRVLTFFVVLLLALNPESMMLAAFIDAVGIEMLLYLLEAQIAVLFITGLRGYLKPFLYSLPLWRLSPWVPNSAFLQQHPGTWRYLFPSAVALLHALVLTAMATLLL